MEASELMTKVLLESEKNGHIPVLLQETLHEFSVFQGEERNLHYFDGTFGRGGHYSALQLFFGDRLKTLAMDQDHEAIAFAQKKFQTEVERSSLRLIHANFSDFSQHVQQGFDMMLIDLGVSSPQLDQAHRGFSFYHEGPLDMRMNQMQETTAEQVIHEMSEDDLNLIFQKYGEIRKPYRVVRALVHDRKSMRFNSTHQLASLIERVEGWKKKGMHPATQFFMALRIFVNQELRVLEETLPTLIASLNPGGRLAVISFHSLEDRIVKYAFKESARGQQTHKKVIIASEAEAEKNTRARSAKLRVFEKNKEDLHV